MWLLSILGAVAALVVLWYATLIIGGLAETQRVGEFVPVGPGGGGGGAGAATVPPPPYVAAMSAQALAAGYPRSAYLRHVKHRLVVALHAAPDRRTLAAIVGGSAFGMPVKRTMLLSRLANGKVLKTTDEIGLPDLTGLYARQLVLNGSFAELRDAHDPWLADAGDLVATFADADPVAAYLALDAEDAARQVAFGYSRYIDPGRTRFRHTLRGALAHAFRGAARAAAEARPQRDRANLKRPG